jgi:hypothetical protein
VVKTHTKTRYETLLFFFFFFFCVFQMLTNVSSEKNYSIVAIE